MQPLQPNGILRFTSATCIYCGELWHAEMTHVFTIITVAVSHSELTSSGPPIVCGLRFPNTKSDVYKQAADLMGLWGVNRLFFGKHQEEQRHNRKEKRCVHIWASLCTHM